MIFDLHCDTLLHMLLKGQSLENAEGHINIEKLRRGGVSAQCFAAFLSDCGEMRPEGGREPWGYFELFAKLLETELERNRRYLRPALSVADVEKNRREGLISAVFTVEDAVLLEGDIDRVSALYDRGVRMMSLTWNYENSLGFPNSSEPDQHARGLKPFGREAVEAMEAMGIAVDVSHLSEGGFWDVAGQMKKPFIASHSCARALCDHSRNLTDRQLRAIGEHGGVCGVNFYSRFLSEGAELSRIEDIVRHMSHIANVAGIDAVALGSDFDGVDCELELGDCGGLPLLVDAMGRRFSSGEIEKICRLNAERAFADALGG